jgi:hypothetical protein
MKKERNINMKLIKQVSGFVVLMGLIFIALQLFSYMAEKGSVPTLQGPKFAPSQKLETSAAKAESSQEKSVTKPVNQTPETENENGQVPEPSQPVTPQTDAPAFVESGPVAQPAEPAGPSSADESALNFPKAQPRKAEPAEVKLKESDFIAMDQDQDRMTMSSEKAKSRLGWGLVGKYDEPDLPVRILGGRPFAIETGQEKSRHFLISMADKAVKPVSQVNAVYSTIGIDAFDPQLRTIVKNSVRLGKLSCDPESLKYCYLLSLSTQRYLMYKVSTAFEWYIQQAGMPQDQAETFRQKARLRMDVWKVVRENGGEMGVAIPIYFDMEGKKQFLPAAYYPTDSEAVRLNITINPNDY